MRSCEQRRQKIERITLATDTLGTGHIYLTIYKSKAMHFAVQPLLLGLSFQIFLCL